MYFFSKKIKCLNCQGNFKGITERGTQKYVCTNYANHRTCIRHVVDQNKLIYLAHKHIEVERLKVGIGLGGRQKKGESDITVSEIKEYVSHIHIDPNSMTIEIFYADETKTYVSDSRISY